MAQISTADYDSVDDFYFSALFDQDGEEIFPVSDDKYAEELQFQEALMSATLASQRKVETPSCSIMAFQAIPFAAEIKRLKIEEQQVGESSLSFCDICVERKEADEMFTAGSCVHSYCTDCVGRHVMMRLQERITIITCPGENCKYVLGLDICRPVFPKAVLDFWEDTLCREFIDASQRFYCPYRDCSSMLMNDAEGEVIRESECPFCHRLFCAQCNVPWHSGVECEQYQRLSEDERGREDLMVRELANQKKWGRCPHCKFYVERTDGCPHITCRCGFQFCYGCGAEWTTSHGGCHRN